MPHWVKLRADKTEKTREIRLGFESTKHVSVATILISKSWLSGMYFWLIGGIYNSLSTCHVPSTRLTIRCRMDVPLAGFGLKLKTDAEVPNSVEVENVSEPPLLTSLLHISEEEHLNRRETSGAGRNHQIVAQRKILECPAPWLSLANTGHLSHGQLEQSIFADPPGFRTNSKLFPTFDSKKSQFMTQRYRVYDIWWIYW